jgi:hypothetical protein
MSLDSLVNPGELVYFSVEILPRAAGPVPLQWEIQYYHHLERESLTERGMDRIEVSRLDRSGPSISIGGDVLGAGAIKQGERVIVQRVGSAEVPEALGYCTHCGKALDVA